MAKWRFGSAASPAMEAHEQVRPRQVPRARRRGPGVVRRRHKVGRRRQELEPPVDLDVVLLARRLADEHLPGSSAARPRRRKSSPPDTVQCTSAPSPNRRRCRGRRSASSDDPSSSRQRRQKPSETGARPRCRLKPRARKRSEALAHVVEHRRPRVDHDASDVVQVLQLETQLALAARHVDDGRRPELFDDEPPEGADAVAAGLREDGLDAAAAPGVL